MRNEKKYINLPGYAYYRYDVAFKKKVLGDIDQGLIGERQAALLYRFNRNNLGKWRKDLNQAVVTEKQEPKKAKYDQNPCQSPESLH